MMRLNTLLVCFYFVLHIFFGAEIQARSSRTIPSSCKGKISKTQNTKGIISLPKKAPNKSGIEFYNTYCELLQELNLVLRACQNADKWKAKYQEIKQKQKMMEKTTTTGKPLKIIRVY